MQSYRVEAVVDGDIACESVVDAFLRLDGQHRSPTGHGGRPLDRVHADVGAAIDRHHAVAVMASTSAEKLNRQFDFGRIEARCFEDLVADPKAAFGIDHPIIETINDHRAVVG